MSELAPEKTITAFTDKWRKIRRITCNLIGTEDTGGANIIRDFVAQCDNEALIKSHEKNYRTLDTAMENVPLDIFDEDEAPHDISAAEIATYDATISTAFHTWIKDAQALAKHSGNNIHSESFEDLFTPLNAEPSKAITGSGGGSDKLLENKVPYLG